MAETITCIGISVEEMNDFRVSRFHLPPARNPSDFWSIVSPPIGHRGKQAKTCGTCHLFKVGLSYMMKL